MKNTHDLAKRILKRFCYLLQPIDSSNQQDNFETDVKGLGNRSDIVKAAFWIFIAIIISIALGQLK